MSFFLFFTKARGERIGVEYGTSQSQQDIQELTTKL